jgi:hypothetical protein
MGLPSKIPSIRDLVNQPAHSLHRSQPVPLPLPVTQKDSAHLALRFGSEGRRRRLFRHTGLHSGLGLVRFT